MLRMAERTGLEPATSGVTGQHSNQLNYRSATKLGSLNAFRGFGNNHEAREVGASRGRGFDRDGGS